MKTRLLIIIGMIGLSLLIPQVLGVYSEKEFDMKDYDDTFTIIEKQVKYITPYKITNAVIDGVYLNCDTATLALSIKSNDAGILQLDVPHRMLSGVFMVLVDKVEWDDLSIFGNILTVNFPENTSNIEILGSYYITPDKYTGVCDVAHDPPYSYIISPLKQIQNGIKFHNVECKDDLKLAKKKGAERSACVTLFTKIELTVRGWAHDDRILLGCTGERVQKCYPDDPSEYRQDLYDYYFGSNEGLPTYKDLNISKLHTHNACTSKPSICYGEFENGTQTRISCDYPTHGCGVKSFDNYKEVENEN